MAHTGDSGGGQWGVSRQGLVYRQLGDVMLPVPVPLIEGKNLLEDCRGKREEDDGGPFVLVRYLSLGRVLLFEIWDNHDRLSPYSNFVPDLPPSAREEGMVLLKVGGERDKRPYRGRWGFCLLIG